MTYGDFELYGMDWEGRGYFGCPAPIASVPGEPWTRWLMCLEDAKNGNFDSLNSLLEIETVANSGVLRYWCLLLAGDAGPSDLLNSLPERLREQGMVDRQLRYSHALASRGRLADIIPMLSVYIREYEYKDASIVPVFISEILGYHAVPSEPREQFRTVAAYAEHVRAQHAAATDRFGTDEVLLYLGQILSVGALAKDILDQLASGVPFDEWLRRRFEAMTGVDCSG